MSRASAFLENYGSYMHSYAPHEYHRPHREYGRYDTPRYHQTPHYHTSHEMDYDELEELLRRENPDLLEKIRFHVSDGEWGKLTGLLAKGAFHAAAIAAAPAILGPAVALKAYLKHRDIKKKRQEAGIYKKRLRFRYDDDDMDQIAHGNFFV